MPFLKLTQAAEDGASLRNPLPFGERRIHLHAIHLQRPVSTDRLDQPGVVFVIWHTMEDTTAGNCNCKLQIGSQSSGYSVPMRLYLGIDGGGTKTAACIADETGVEIG